MSAGRQAGKSGAPAVAAADYYAPPQTLRAAEKLVASVMVDEPHSEGVGAVARDEKAMRELLGASVGLDPSLALSWKAGERLEASCRRRQALALTSRFHSTRGHRVAALLLAAHSTFRSSRPLHVVMQHNLFLLICTDIWRPTLHSRGCSSDSLKSPSSTSSLLDSVLFAGRFSTE
jgi:hypothetical protein